MDLCDLAPDLSATPAIAADPGGDAGMEISGRDLVEHGILVSIHERPGAATILYQKMR